MFNQKVIDVLNEINTVTNSVILKYPKTIAVSEAQDIMVMFDVSKLDADEFNEIGLKDSLSELLNLFKLFEGERTVDIDGNTINIESGDMSSTYIMDSIILMDAYNKDPKQFEKTDEVPNVAVFDLTVEDIKKIKSSTAVFKDLDEVIFTSIDSDMKISLGATGKHNAKSHTFSITKPAQTTKEFNVKIPVENFKMLPMSEYTMQVKYNSARDSYRLMLKSKSLEDFQIIMSVKV